MSIYEMSTDELIERYETMTAEEKGEETKRALHFDASPLHILLSILLVWEPAEAKLLFARMKAKLV